MIESGQFQRENEAEQYFELLDIDKNGNVSLTEFLAPLIPLLSKEQVVALINNSTFRIEDLSTLRQIYEELR